MKEKDCKIVVLGHQVLTQRLMDELCLDDLVQDFDIEYWNCNALCVPHVDLMSNAIQRPWASDVNDIKTLKKKLNELPVKTIAVLKIFVNADMYDVHKIIGPKVSCGVLYYLNKGIWDCMLGQFAQSESNYENSSPNNQTQKHHSIFFKIKRWLYNSDTIKTIAMYVKYRGGESFIKFRNEQKIKRMMGFYPQVYYMGVSPTADFVTSHPDFDKILKLKEKKEQIIEEPYIVFIDAFYPYHADWKERNPSFDWNALAEPYYKSMRTFFDKVEKEYKCEVIIAAHPNANYENNPYGKRKWYKFKTVELVRDCKAVIMHSSNSINFIAYYNKPVCFVSNDAVKAGDFQYCLYEMASSLSNALGYSLIDIDHENSVKNIFKQIDENRRKIIIERYFGDTSKGLPNSEILKTHFNTMFNSIKK